MSASRTIRNDCQCAPCDDPTNACMPSNNFVNTLKVPLAAWKPSMTELLECVALVEEHLECDSHADTITAFHSSAVPPIALSKFCHRIVYHSGYGAEGIAVALALMGRYAKASGIAPTPLTCHRLMLACIVVGMKAMCDRFVQNAHMAPIVGVPLQELNRLEVALLRALDFSVMPNARELVGISPRLLALQRAQDAQYDPSALYHALSAYAPTPVPLRGLPQSPATWGGMVLSPTSSSTSVCLPPSETSPGTHSVQLRPVVV